MFLEIGCLIKASMAGGDRACVPPDIKMYDFVVPSHLT